MLSQDAIRKHAANAIDRREWATFDWLVPQLHDLAERAWYYDGAAAAFRHDAEEKDRHAAQLRALAVDLEAGARDRCAVCGAEITGHMPRRAYRRAGVGESVENLVAIEGLVVCTFSCTAVLSEERVARALANGWTRRS